MITLSRWAEIATAERLYATHSLREVEADLAEETKKIFSGDTRYRPSVFFSHNAASSYCDNFQTNHELLRDCLLPLVVNAIRSTPEGTVTVTMSLQPDSRELVVDIEDIGHGIHPDHHERIFEPYEKVGEHSTGAGLGLTIASKFATLLKGSVSLVSAVVGSGSHFRGTSRVLEYGSSPSPA